MEQVKTAAQRETWLANLTDHYRAWFKDAGYEVPENIRVNCGWPIGNALRGKSGTRTIGQCFDPTWSESGLHEIFISPAINDSLKVGGVLVHEIAHAVVGTKHGHKAPFKRCALAVGLDGKMTATTETQALNDYTQQFIDANGEYPHSIMDMSKREKQTTRMFKACCANPDCETDERGNKYTVRLSRSWIEKAGAPLCPLCHGQLDVQ